MERSDIALLVIAASPKPVQPVRLQKSLFIINKNVPNEKLKVDTFYDFQPYDYGPFCVDIYRDVERMATQGLVEVHEVVAGSYKLVSASTTGAERAVQLKNEVAPDVSQYISQVINWVSSLTFNQLVRAIYTEYPETKVNSVFRDAAL